MATTQNTAPAVRRAIATIIPFPSGPSIRRTAAPRTSPLLGQPSNPRIEAALLPLRLSESQYKVLLGCDEAGISPLLDVYYSDLKALEKRSLVRLHLPVEGNRAGRWTITDAGSATLQACQIMLHEA
jgi:hypothetical protein